MKKIFRKIFPHKSTTDFPISYIANRFFMERTKRGPVLVIGDYTNRDYDTLKKCFKEVYSLDVIENDGRVPEKYYLQQSVEDPIPFPDGYFKTIIFAEVVENTWRDRDAMLELNRVLAPDGVLLMSLEFYADEPVHYHIYSPDSLALLVAHSGFKVDETRYQGFVTKFIGAKVTALLAILAYPLWGTRSLEKVNSFTWALDGLFKNHKFPNSIFEMTAYIRASKTATVDPVKVQVAYFEPQLQQFKKNQRLIFERERA